METNFWIELAKIAAGILTGGGLWAWIKTREDKRKTPYDMLRDLLAVARDTVVLVRDSIITPAVAVHCGVVAMASNNIYYLKFD